MIGSPLLIAAKARARLQKAIDSVQGGRVPDIAEQVNIANLPSAVDVITTAAEVNELHGTGTLLFRMFPDSSSIISLRSSNFYDGRQTFGAAAYCLPSPQASRAEIYSWVKWYLTGTKVRRVLTIPYLPNDPVVSLAVRDQFDVPLCTYIMDDKNVCADGISDELMEEMLAKSNLRLVISPEMRDAYEEKYQMRFWVMPPLVPERMLHRETIPLSPETDMRRGALLGNIWGQRWLDMLRECFRGSGYQIDWYCNSKDPVFLDFDRDELKRDGITIKDPVVETSLPSVLSQYAFAVVPSDMLDGNSPSAVEAIAEFSLPSRIPTLVATSHLPILTLGSSHTCAARFVRRFALGEVAPYQRAAVDAAIRRLIEPDRQAEIRQRAAELSKHLSSEGSGEWIWQSLAEGRVMDLRYENLMPATVPL